MAVGPPGEAAVRAGAVDAGVELPEEFSGGSVEGNDFLFGGDGVEDAFDDDGSGFEAAGFAGVELPCELEVCDVGAIDLLEGGVVGVAGVASGGKTGSSSPSRTKR